MTDRSVLFVLVFVLLAGGACDPGLDRFNENDRYYSVFGYLVADADSHVIRVEPLRDGMRTRAPERLDVDVTLTNLEMGRTVTLEDSLWQFHENATAHNFSTEFDIEPRTQYRLTVTGPGGARTTVHTAIPDTFPTPYWMRPDLPATRALRLVIEGIDHLVAVKTLWTTRSGALFDFDHLADTIHVAGEVRARLSLSEDAREYPDLLENPRKIEVMVAAGDPAWPDFLGLNEETKALPTVATNVDNGVGFVGGAVTDTVLITREWPPSTGRGSANEDKRP